MDYVLYHHGVKGMKWGVRRYQRKDGSRTSLGERHQLKLNRSYDDVPRTVKKKTVTSAKADIKKVKSTNNDSKKNELTDEQRAERRKKAIKVGAAVVGTAVAAYGTYKLASYMQDKRTQSAMKKAQDYIDSNIFKNMGQTTFKDGTVKFDFADKAGNEIVMKGSRSQVGKYIGQQNAKTIATGRQIYKDATNTRLDKGLAKIVDTGDAVGNTAKKAATSAGNTAKKAATSAGNTAKRAATSVSNTAKKTARDIDGLFYEYRQVGKHGPDKTFNFYQKVRKKRR